MTGKREIATHNTLAMTGKRLDYHLRRNDGQKRDCHAQYARNDRRHVAQAMTVIVQMTGFLKSAISLSLRIVSRDRTATNKDEILK